MLGGQQVERADRVDPPAPRRGEVGDGVLDDAAAAASSSAVGPVEVVGRQQPQRDDLDADLLAPAEELLDLVGAGLVARAGVALPGLAAQRRLPSRMTPTCRGDPVAVAAMPRAGARRRRRPDRATPRAPHLATRSPRHPAHARVYARPPRAPSTATVTVRSSPVGRGRVRVRSDGRHVCREVRVDGTRTYGRVGYLFVVIETRDPAEHAVHPRSVHVEAVWRRFDSVVERSSARVEADVVTWPRT